ncbi:C-C chemokine receptor type 10 [Nothobranchius furzeri]|uniref:C-C chemokine receptor type 10 n=1 Tax=Nothobranchius furzeri TaxID=105023 RepID=UPI0039047564
MTGLLAKDTISEVSKTQNPSHWLVVAKAEPSLVFKSARFTNLFCGRRKMAWDMFNSTGTDSLQVSVEQQDERSPRVTEVVKDRAKSLSQRVHDVSNWVCPRGASGSPFSQELKMSQSLHYGLISTLSEPLFSNEEWYYQNLSNDSYSDYDGHDSDLYGGPDKHQENMIKTFQTCAFCVIFLLGVVGNCLVIATFARYCCLRLRSMTDVFLFHLALADLILLLTIPLQAIDTHLGWIFPALICKIMRACYAINTYSGLLLLACISVDRYMVVTRAHKMLRLRSLILTAGNVAAVGVWIAAVLLSLPEIIYSGVNMNAGSLYCGLQAAGLVRMAPSGTIIAVFCVSFVIMVTCYTSIGVVLWGGHVHRKGKQWHRQRTLKLMVFLVLAFLMFQLPYTLILSLKLAGKSKTTVLEYATCTLAYSRCCLNPILYGLVGMRFRKDVLQLMHDLGCPCGFQLRLQMVSSTSISATSPALTVPSVCSPTSPDRSISSGNAESSLKFHFPAARSEVPVLT